MNRMLSIFIVTIISTSCTNKHALDGELLLFYELDLFEKKLSLEYQDQYYSADINGIIEEIDEVYKFIEDIMKELVRFTSSNCEYISGLEYKYLSNTKTVEELMLGDNMNGLAYELSSKFTNLKTIIGEKSSFEITSYILDSSDPPIIEPMEELSWEENSFLGLQLITAINFLKLKQIQLLYLKLMLNNCK